MADIAITTEVGFYQIESLTEEGAAWMWSNISEAESIGNGALVAFVEGDSYTKDIMLDALEEELVITVDGRAYHC